MPVPRPSKGLCRIQQAHHSTGRARPHGRAKALRAKRHQLVRAMIDRGVPVACSGCGLGPVWRDRPLTLAVDHMSGDWLDNRLENLRFMCPNCHAQTATWCRQKSSPSLFPGGCSPTAEATILNIVQVKVQIFSRAFFSEDVGKSVKPPALQAENCGFDSRRPRQNNGQFQIMNYEL